MFNEMDDAPKDGTPILTFWGNGCGWECVVVWWSGVEPYPWNAGHNAYSADKFSYWQVITYPGDDL